MVLAVYCLVGLVTVSVLREMFLTYSPGVYTSKFFAIHTLGFAVWPIIWFLIISDLILVNMIKKETRRKL